MLAILVVYIQYSESTGTDWNAEIIRSNWATFTSINILKNAYQENNYFKIIYYNNYLCLQPL